MVKQHYQEIKTSAYYGSVEGCRTRLVQARNDAVSSSGAIIENLLSMRPFAKPKVSMQITTDETFVGICRIGRELSADDAEKKVFHSLVEVSAAFKGILSNVPCMGSVIKLPSVYDYVVFNNTMRNIGCALEKVEYICMRLDYEGDLRKLRGNYLSNPTFVSCTLTQLYEIFFILHWMQGSNIPAVDCDDNLQMAIYSLIEAICDIQEFVSFQNSSTTSDSQLGAKSWAATLRRAITLTTNTVLMASRNHAAVDYGPLLLDAALAVRVVGLAAEYTPEPFVNSVVVLIERLVDEFYNKACIVRERVLGDTKCDSYAGVSITSACIARHALNMYRSYMHSEDPSGRKVSICRSYFKKAVVCEICLYAKAAMCTIENKLDVPILTSRIQTIIDLCELIHDLYVEIEKITLNPEECRKEKRSENNVKGLYCSIVYSVRCICANVACLTIHHKQNLTKKTLRYLGGVAICANKALDIFSEMPSLHRSCWLSEDYDVLRVFPDEVGNGACILTSSPTSFASSPVQIIETSYGQDLHRYIKLPYHIDRISSAISTFGLSRESRGVSTFISNIAVFSQSSHKSASASRGK